MITVSSYWYTKSSVEKFVNLSAYILDRESEGLFYSIDARSNLDIQFRCGMSEKESEKISKICISTETATLFNEIN